MSRPHINVTARYQMTPEALWEVIADHEGMERWLGTKVRVESGDGGEGTIRSVMVGPLKLEEEILAFTPPTRMVYRVSKGLPVRYHQAVMVVTPTKDGGSELNWRVTIDSRVPGVARMLLRGVKRNLTEALRRLPPTRQ